MLHKGKAKTPVSQHGGTVKEVLHHTVIYLNHLITSILQITQQLFYEKYCNFRHSAFFFQRPLILHHSSVSFNIGHAGPATGKRHKTFPCPCFSRQEAYRYGTERREEGEEKAHTCQRSPYEGVYLPQMYTISVKQTKKTGIFAPIFKGSLCRFRKKTYICPF